MENRVYILATQDKMERVLPFLTNIYYPLEDMLYLLVQLWFFGIEREEKSCILNEVHFNVMSVCHDRGVDEVSTEKECAAVWTSLEKACELLSDDLVWLDKVDLSEWSPTAANVVAGDLYVQFEPHSKWSGGPNFELHNQ